MRHRAIAAAAATSALVIGTALPSAASQTPTERPTCEDLGLMTLLESADGASTANDIASGTISPSGSTLNVQLLSDQHEIGAVIFEGESGIVAVAEDQLTELTTSGHVDDPIVYWVVCGNEIGAEPAPTETEPTTEPSHTGSPEPTHSKTPKVVPTNIPAGSDTLAGDTPWALFGLAAASAMAAALAGTVMGRRRKARGV